MGLQINRLEYTDESTIGEMCLDGEFQCWTLEDTCRHKKIDGKTAIPPGVYDLVITHSARFKRDLPLLVGVPGFEGVRIHPGNSAGDTEGCILVGCSRDRNWIGSSRAAFDALMPKIEERLKTGKLTIGISGGGRTI